LGVGVDPYDRSPLGGMGLGLRKARRMLAHHIRPIALRDGLLHPLGDRRRVEVIVPRLTRL